MSYRYRETLYQIEVRQGDVGSPAAVWLDGTAVTDGRILLADDGIEHNVTLHWPRPSS
jgi:cyclic beta-1,2-glucan synthetase